MRIKLLLASALLIGALQATAQSASQKGTPQKQKHTTVQRKFNVLLLNEESPTYVQGVNGLMQEEEAKQRAEDTRGLLTDALRTAFSSTLIGRASNITANVLSFTISTIKEATKSKRGEWYKAAQQQCSFSRKLSSNSYKDDFYALPSQKGALDPQNMKFRGFGLQHYLEVQDNAELGQEVLKFFCHVKKDQQGIKNIVNHGKFLVDLTEFSFNPTYCGLPNDSCTRELTKFDFDKRENLAISVRVKFFSSWFNEAIMLTRDQQIGEFIISARITPDLLNNDGLFIYDPANPKHRAQVSVSGDCFMVPRSFTGTADAANYTPTWGTGEYRVEMEVSETCRIKDSYYQIRESGNGEAQVFAALPGKTRWDKAKWKTEWTAMKQMRRSTPFFKGLWQSIVTAAKGSGWVETFTDPLTTAIISAETKQLTTWLQAPLAQTSAQKTQAQGSAQKPQGQAAGGATGQPQQGTQPLGKQAGTSQPPMK